MNLIWIAAGILLQNFNHTQNVRFLLSSKIFLGAILLVLSVNVRPAVELDGNYVNRISVGEHLSVLEDPSGKLILESMLAHPESYLFTPFINEIPSFGYTNSTYWARFKIANKSTHNYRWVLEIPYAPLDSISVFAEKEGVFIEKKAGDALPFSIREIEYPTAAFFLETLPLQEQWVYLRINSTSSVQIPVVLWSEKSFISEASSTLLFWGVYFGALLIAAGYNLFLYFSLKDRVYALYVGFVLMVLLFQAAVQGFASQYLWANYPQFTNIILLLSLNMLGFFAGTFSIVFLRLKDMLPVLNRILLVVVSIMVLNILLSAVVPYRMVLRLTILLFAIGSVVLIIAGAISWSKGYRPARIYLLAWLAMLAGTITYALKTLGLVPSTFFTAYAATIGSAIEVILLSLAIGDRVNVDRKDKRKAQKQLLDIQKELLASNQHALENAELSDRKKQEFLSTMSHELRTPLNGILGCSQLLQESTLSTDDSNTVSYLSTSAKQMLSHVNRILNFSQLHEGKLVNEEVVFDMVSIGEALTLAYQIQCEEKKLSFEVNTHQSVAGYYRGDKQKILMILSDMIENAIKFTTKGGIKVDITEQGNESEVPDYDVERWLTFSVSDSGCGISNSNKDDIFKMFLQEDGSFKREYEGLGLGLAICKKFVELLRGDISFESIQGKGTIFYVKLPLSKIAARIKDDSSSSHAHLYESNQNILVVEDNPTNQMILVKMLKTLKYSSTVANNGVEALEQLNKKSFDVVLMDCHMPVMDGFEATHTIRSTDAYYNEIPIIAVTANSLAGDRERCLQAGMNDYIAKPFSKELVASKLKFWLLNHPSKLSE